MPENESAPVKPEARPDVIESLTKLAQVVSVVIGVVISVLSFNQTRQQEANARGQEALTRKVEAETRHFETMKYYNQRQDEADKRRVEAAKPFLELRQKRYAEAVEAVAILASPKNHTHEEVNEARKKFWDLYWAKLSMVEGREVETKMIDLGHSLDPHLAPNSTQQNTYHLAHSLRDSLVSSWGIDEQMVKEEETHTSPK